MIIYTNQITMMQQTYVKVYIIIYNFRILIIAYKFKIQISILTASSDLLINYHSKYLI